MKFKIVRSKFLESLKRVQNIVVAKSSMMIIQNVQIEAKEIELEELEREQKEKQKELTKKQYELNYYQSDENIEKKAREELGLVMPQEIVFIPNN